MSSFFTKDEQIEEFLFSCIFSYPEVFDEICFEEKYFKDRKLLNWFKKIYQEYGKLDVETAIKFAKDKQKAIDRLMDLVSNYIVGKSEVYYYYRKLKELYIKNETNELVNKLNNHDIDYQTFTSSIEELNDIDLDGNKGLLKATDIQINKQIEREYTNIKELDYLLKGIEYGKLSLWSGITNHGKQQRNSEIIPTANGDKRIDELKIGDYVFDYDGKPTKVIGIFPQGYRDVYRVHFSDKSYLDVGLEHLWGFNYTREGKVKYVVKDTKWLYENQGKQNIKRYKLPMTAINYGENNAATDAYLFGLYLADGSSIHNQVLITKKDFKVCKYLDTLDTVKKQYNSINKYIFDAKHSLSKYVSKKLKGLKSKEKYIPNEWFQKSYEIRKELLYGLMDGDGTLRQDNDKGIKQCHYETTSIKLAKDVRRLVTSLGGSANITIAKKGGYKWYRITVHTDFYPFKHSYEEKEWKRSRYLSRTVIKVEKLEKDYCTCIMVDNDKGLYIGDVNFNIVTHNTTLMTQFAKECLKQHKKIFYFSGEQTASEFKNYLYVGLCNKEQLDFIKDEHNDKIYDAVPKQQMIDYFDNIYSDSLFIYDNNMTDNTVTNMLKIMRKAYKTGVRIFFIDNFMQLDNSERLEEQTKIVELFKRFARDNNCIVNLVAHPRKTQFMKSRLTIFDIAGTQNIANKSANICTIMRTDILPDSEKDEIGYVLFKHGYNIEKCDGIVEVIKTKGNSCKMVGLIYDKELKTYKEANKLSQEDMKSMEFKYSKRSNKRID